MRHCELLIDGQFYGGPCDQETSKSVLRSPYSGSVVGSAAEAGWTEVVAALEAAHRTFPSWSESPRRTRAAILRRAASLIREQKADLAELLALEIGKPITLAEGELDRAALVFDLSADPLSQPIGRVLASDYDPRGDKVQVVEERFPIGPLFCITPYNWPFLLAAHKVGPALAAGCSVVVKGSPLSPLSTLTLGRILHEAGAWPGTVNFIHCEADLAEKAVQHPLVAGVSFTGSDKVGWHIKSLVPRKKVLLELGGDAAALLLPGCDLQSAVKACVSSAFAYAGQVCISLQRLLVEESLYEEAKEAAIEATQAISSGDPLDRATWCGPVIHSEAADRILSWVEEAEQQGARVVAGGSRTGQVIEPILIEGVPDTCRLGQEEAFGPVLLLESVASFEEGLERINRSRFGIHASLFTPDLRQAQKAFRTLKVGGVVVNGPPNLRFDGMPYGGVKDSGWGREGIESAIQEITEPRVLIQNWA